jgi:GT2 family glycosyltransferase
VLGEKYMKTTVGVACYNCLKYTKDTIDSIRRIRDAEFHLCVVDNGSTDGSKEYFNQVLANSSNTTYIDNQKNLGAPKAWNQIIADAESAGHDDIVYILNNDVILGKNWLSNLNTFFANHPEAGVVSSHVVDGLYKAEDIHADHDKWFEWTENYCKDTGSKIDEGAHFCAFGITKECLKKVGIFDEGYIKTSYEDADYTLRTEIEGLKVLTTYNSVIFHYGGVTQSMMTAQSGNEFQRINRAYFEHKFGVYLEGSICSRSVFWDKADETNWKRRIPV